MFKNNHDFYKICFDNSREGIIVTDEYGIVQLANKRVEKIFGYKPTELINQSVNILLPKSVHLRHQKDVSDFHNKPRYSNGFDRKDLYGIHKNGNKISVLIGLNQFEINNKKYVKAFITDISDYKEKEQLFRNLNYKLEQELKIKNRELKDKNKLLRETNNVLKAEIQNKIDAEKKVKKALIKERELNNLKTKFISLASHEFRTPLSGILTSATLLEKHYTLNNLEKVEKHIQLIKAMVNHLNSILQDFLTLEQINIGEIKYKYSTINIYKLTNKIISETKSLLKKEQRINYVSNNSNQEIVNDLNIISSIMTNLLYNAIKYSHEDSIIIIDTKIEEDFLIILIKDSGIGIPKEDQKHIFERFFRAKNAMEIQGTGIGLNIIKGHVDGLGGEISFTSKLNEGTIFKVVLPNFKLT